MKKKISLQESLTLGMGIASIAKERAEDFIEYIAKEGKTAIKDQGKLRARLMARGEKEYHAMARGYDRAVRKTLKTLNVPTRSEFEALKRKVEGKKKT